MSIFFEFLPLGLYTSVAAASEDTDMPRDGFILKSNTHFAVAVDVSVSTCVVLATQPVAAALISVGAQFASDPFP